MRHDDPMFPFAGARGAARLLGVMAIAALLVGVAAHRHPRGTLEPWRPGPASWVEGSVSRQLTPPVDTAARLDGRPAYGGR